MTEKKIVTFGETIFEVREIRPGYRVAIPVEDDCWLLRFCDAAPKTTKKSYLK